MAFETRPFNLGNTFAQASQIQALQSRNAFAQAQLEALQQQREQESAINTFLGKGGDPQELGNRFGSAGRDIASEITKLASDRTREGAANLKLVIDTGMAANDAINAALSSNSPRQSIKAALKIPILADSFGNLGSEIDSMSDEELIAALQQADIETDIFRSPQELSRLISGQEAIDLGARPGTLLEQTSGGGEPTSTRVVQGPEGKGFNVNINTREFETPGSRDVETRRLRNVKQLSSELAQSIRNVRANPRASGLIGVGSDTLNRLGDVPVLGDIITAGTETLTGLDPAELSRVLTQSKLLVAKLVQVVTGDTSGRYTEQEQQRTIDVQAQSKFWKSSEQIQGGLGELQAITIRGEINIRGAAAIQDFTGQPLNIFAPDGIQIWGDFLIDSMGLSEKAAADEIRKHLEMMRNQ